MIKDNIKSNHFNMKKTVYFTGSNIDVGQLASSISAAEQKRDVFLADTENNISEIDSEEIKFITHGPHNNYCTAIITLTYYTNQ